ncbi:methionine--tRNA ligase [Candidatus Liberibacter africanus]|uniref:Methionine--tRNA ligase n=1 Tax=Candidatus Liberibacter africanus PTSAPSY TaxID=1277257 RepID=A0A0G3I3C1_LIBAF|nr:methionine--tRNA ligase [Candidatus Liberibacter africanus]AKK19745.1 methionyl-tRNA synthetase [Candidatus Liberibacter africanus PTSAPSY]
MVKNREKLYISTAIAYPNAQPHIGHAYEMIIADVMARFYRLDGLDVLFTTGTDEHGQKIAKAAQQNGLETKIFVDKNSRIFHDMADVLNISYDDFIRTTEKRHHDTCQILWKKILDQGDIYKGSYSGWYSLRDEAYYSEDEVYKGEDGQHYNVNNNPVQWTEEEGYFFRLSAYQERLLAYYDSHPEFILPLERRNEVISFVKSGLKDLSLSRKNFDWGIKIPDDPRYIMYVWIDALTNYLTVTGLLDDSDGKKAKFWPADLHVIGKDIVRFHAVYWPCFLLSANLPLPRKIFAHGFILNKGTKISKSLGNVIDPIEVIEEFGIDALRYFLVREISCGKDGFYDNESVKKRANSDLANGIGNLVSRSVSMILKDYDGEIPIPGDFSECDNNILSICSKNLPEIRDHMNNQLLHKALAQVISLVSEVDRYFDAQKPWDLRKTDPKRASTVLYVTVEVIRQLAILLQAFIPNLANKIFNILLVAEENRCFKSLDHRLKSGIMLEKKFSSIFPRFI